MEETFLVTPRIVGLQNCVMVNLTEDPLKTLGTESAHTHPLRDDTSTPTLHCQLFCYT